MLLDRLSEEDSDVGVGSDVGTVRGCYVSKQDILQTAEVTSRSRLKKPYNITMAGMSCPPPPPPQNQKKKKTHTKKPQTNNNKKPQTNKHPPPPTNKQQQQQNQQQTNKQKKKKGKADLTTVLHIRELPHLHMKLAVWFSFPTTNNKNPMIPP